MTHGRLIISTLLAALMAMATAVPALAHGGGHRGGCEDFGHFNLLIAQDPAFYGALFGVPEARNLGDIVSIFAVADDGIPGVREVVVSDHALCGYIGTGAFPWEFAQKTTS